MKLILLLFLVSLSVAWDPVAPGIEYQYLRLDKDPNDVFVLRVDRSNKKAIIDTMVAKEKAAGARERTTSMYSRYDDSLTTWLSGGWDGTRYKAVGAVNGYYFDMETGLWISGGISNGWYMHRFDDDQKKAGFGSGYGIRYDHSVFIGECVKHTVGKNYVVFPKKPSHKFPIDAINEQRGKDNVIVYTPQYDFATPAADSGVEVLIELTTAAGITYSGQRAVGIVTAVYKKTGSTIIPFDSIVISASGSRADKLMELANTGDRVELYQDMDQFDEATCSKPVTGNSWHNTFSALGGAYHYLKGGKQVIYEDWPRHPRTAMAFNDKYIYYYVVDGRTSKSRGMTIDELGAFALKYLNATDGIALDGGGSSTMVVNGKIVNHPSDGSERTVTNAVLMAVQVAKERSTKFISQAPVVLISQADVYTGPGTNYHKITQKPANAAGRIMAHKLAGIRAKGTYWWKVSFDKTEGWVDEKRIAKKN